jgi:cytochrome b involved in lipid metabolism
MNAHAKKNFLSLAAYKGIIYDLTEFIYQHPGGGEAISSYKGKSLD